MSSTFNYVWSEIIVNQSRLLFVSDPKMLGGAYKTLAQKIVVGLSCLLYLLPTWYAHSVGYNNFALIYLLITITSFFSDTSFFYQLVNGQLLGLVTICDRWTASTGVILNVFLIFKEFYLHFISKHLIFELLIILVAFKVFTLSRNSSRNRIWGWQWCFYHSTWHVISAPGAIYGIYVDKLNYS